MDATEGHQGARRHDASSASEAIEDYAKAVFALQRRLGGPVGTTAMAERLGVSPSTVTAMLKRMDEMGLVKHERYRGVTLTGEGERIALAVVRHHRLLESYLAEALGMPWDRVHAEAEVLEHYISEELEERIAVALGDPSHDPHGDPIPNRDLSLAAERATVLSELPAGRSGTFSQVSDSDPAMLRYLDELGIRPGTALRVKQVEPFGGGILIEVDGREQFVGAELAARMLIS